MKKSLWIGWFFMACVAGALPCAEAAAAPPPAEPEGPGTVSPDPDFARRLAALTGATSAPGTTESLAGSHVAFDGGSRGYDFCWSPGSQRTFCFEASSFTDDWEYVYDLWVRFPSDWVVHDAFDDGPDSCAGGTFGPFAWQHYGGSPFEVEVDQTRTHQPADACLTYLCFGVTAGAGGGDAEVSWYWDGDGLGAAPHHPCSADGYTPFGQQPCDQWDLPPAAIPECAPGLYVLPEVLEAEGCNGLPQSHALTVWNNTGAEANVVLTYTLLEGSGEVGGPPSVYLPDGATAGVTLEAVPHLCLGPGDRFLAEILASGNGFAALATLDKTITSGGWTPVPDSAPPWAGKGFPGDGCTARNAAGEWVTYVIGDRSQITGLRGYDHSSGAWLPVAAAGTPDDRWAPDWAYDAEANLCYLTGGATAPGPGNLREAYRFDPAAGVFTALPPFTTPRNFHDSWVGRVGGAKVLCVGGGAGPGSAVLGTTQCCEPEALPVSWGPENALLGGYPSGGRFAAADGTLLAPEGDRFWFSSGGDGSLDTADTAWYFDGADGTWHAAGGTGQPLLRTEGEFFGASFYQLGGTQDLTHASDAVFVHDGEGWAPFAPLTNPRMSNVVGVTDTALLSVDGYDGGTGPEAYLEELLVCPECPEADLRVTKTADPDPAVAGSPLAYTVTVTNLGPDGALEVSAADALPPDAAYVSCLADRGVCAYNPSRHAVSASGFDLGALESMSLVILVIPQAEGELSNTAEAFGASQDPDLRNNTVTVTTGVGGRLTFYDDYGRSWLCVNEYDYSWEWTAQDPRMGSFTLSGAGRGHYQAGILSVHSLPGTPWSLSLKYYVAARRATGSLAYQAYRLRSALSDQDVTNDPPVCGP